MNEQQKQLMFSSAKEEWSTPRDLFHLLDKKYHFTLDPCASPENAVCEKYYTKEDDGLSKDWSGEIVFCNPPYGRDIGKWVRKCYEESQNPPTVVVLLVPARTDTAWFHTYVYHRADVHFIHGRLKFGGAKHNAPFPSMIAVFC